MSNRPWSITTTIRNPKRIKDLIRVLSNFEEEEYNEDFKINFEKELIRTLNYKPTKLEKETREKFKLGETLKEEEAEKIMKDNPQGIGWEGRADTHLKPLREFGLFYLDENDKIVISQHGKDLISGKVPVSRILLKVLMKWQYPNFFRSSSSMNIRPFIATLRIVDKVNRKWEDLEGKPIGISKKEMGLFILTTTDHKDIDASVAKIIDFRKRKKKYSKNKIEKIQKEIIKDFYGKYSESKENTLIKDYPDNIFRYFVLTDLFTYRGERRYLDLSKIKKREIENILENFSAEPNNFENLKEEVKYRADAQKPSFPWEDNLEELKINYNRKVKIYEELTGQKPKEANKDLSGVDEYLNSINEIERKIKLEKINEDSQEHFNKIPDYIEELRKIRSNKSEFSDISPPLRLEYLVSNILIGLNYATKIKPNYISDDDGWPTFHAPGGAPDIEGYYDNFNMIVEVTLLKSRKQMWKNEPQPVIRHLQNFDKKSEAKSFCLFIAPIIHEDTLNYFWYAMNSGFEKPQNIIPLNLEEFIQLTKKFYEAGKDSKLDDQFIRETLEEFLEIETLDSPSEWLELKEKCLSNL